MSGKQLRPSAGGDRVLRTLERFGEKPGLARITYLLEQLGRPQHAFPAIHVAGTNGKGSTAAMIAAVMQAAGLRVGLFTSPHLIRYNERIVVDGEPIADDALTQLLDEIVPLAEQAAIAPDVGQPTEFEVATAAALTYFARQRVDVAVVEVGLGGRLDSTNVVHPIVTVITPIGVDHTSVLGTTLPAIAEEKAGIMRSGVPAVVAKQTEPARAVLRQRAQDVGAPLYEANVHFALRHVDVDACATTFAVDWTTKQEEEVPDTDQHVFDHSLTELRVPLVGSHQADNGAVAVVASHIALWTLEREERGPGLSEGEACNELPLGTIMRSGLQRVRWPGRFETVASEPLTIVDGAHNAESATALAHTVRAALPERRPVFVLGLLAEKPAEAVLAALLPVAAAIVFTRPSSGRTPPRNPDELAGMARRIVQREGQSDASPTSVLIEVEPEPASALARARQLATSAGVIIVGGSLYLVGEVKSLLAGDPSRSME